MNVYFQLLGCWKSGGGFQDLPPCPPTRTVILAYLGPCGGPQAVGGTCLSASRQACGGRALQFSVTPGLLLRPTSLPHPAEMLLLHLPQRGPKPSAVLLPSLPLVCPPCSLDSDPFSSSGITPCLFSPKLCPAFKPQLSLSPLQAPLPVLLPPCPQCPEVYLQTVCCDRKETRKSAIHKPNCVLCLLGSCLYSS